MVRDIQVVKRYTSGKKDIKVVKKRYTSGKKISDCYQKRDILGALCEIIRWTRRQNSWIFVT